MLPESTGKRFVAGKFTMDFWAALKSVVSKREGPHVVARIDRRVASLPAKTFWADPERLRYAEKTARACMDLAFSASRDEYSFSALYTSILRMATAIDNMPDDCIPAGGLMTKLEDTAMQAMRCAQDRMEAMLATPVTAAQRVTSFVVQGQALNALPRVAGGGG